MRNSIENGTATAGKFAIRSQHRLVATHPIANGNGRHVRLAVDLPIVQLGGRPFS